MALREDQPVVGGLFGLSRSRSGGTPSTSTASRSAADIAEVGWPEFAAAAMPDRVDAELLPELAPSFDGAHRAILRRGSTRVTLGVWRSSRLHELSEHGVSV